MLKTSEAERLPPVNVQVVLLSDKDVAEVIGCARTSVWRYFHEGRLPPPIRIGNSARWRSDEIMKVIEAATNLRDA